MRNAPLILYVPWGKNRGDRFFLDWEVVKDVLQAERKKETPRGNGARRKRKT